MKNPLRQLIRAFGVDIVRIDRQHHPPDFGEEETEIIRTVQTWTMTSSERLYALIQSVRYVCANAIPGAIVECGVWKGGSMAAAARVLLKMEDRARDLYLFDTFQGMTQPNEKDIDYSGKRAADLLLADPSFKCNDAPLEGVKKVLYDTGYPTDRIHFIQGRVEETIPAYAPNPISVLRLDTDWYESTKHELTHLFPRLSDGGVLIVDDYGHWLGARRACDEYFMDNRTPILFNRVDYTGRIALKPCSR